MLWTFALSRQYYNLSELWSHYRLLPIVGKTDLPWANSSKFSWGKFFSGFVFPRQKILWRSHCWVCMVKWKKKSDLNPFLRYLDLIKNVKARVAVSKMRISCHLLSIESGRYKKIPRVERPCLLCNRSEIGDEFHYLLKCTHSSLSHTRGIFLESLYSINSNFTNMSCKALFLYIISMCDENIINLIINLSPRNDPDPGVGIVSGSI